MERGLPTAFCAPCAVERIVWRDADSSAPRCVVCDALVVEAAIRTVSPDDVSEALGLNAWRVTETSEPCGCSDLHADDPQGCGGCPAHGKCAHTRDAGQPLA